MVSLRLNENRNGGSGASGDRGRREQRDQASSQHGSRSISLEPDHAGATAFIDDIDSVSSFPPLRDDHQSPSTNFVNSFSQFKRWPSHAAPPPDPDHPLHKSSSAPVFQENQIGELRSYRSAAAAAGGDLNEIRISDGEKLAAAAAANLGYTNSFTKDRMLKLGALPPSPSPSPSPSTSPPLNPFRTVSDSSSSSESAAVTTPKSKTHVVIGGITCPIVRKLSLVRHQSSSLKEKVSFIKT